MASTEPRTLTPADAEALTGLSTEVGWNQTEDDWRVILERGAGEGIFDPDGRPIASACDVPLTARSRWVCMVLVTTAARRQGLASRLMSRRIAAIEAAGLVPGLDATELGRPVYERLGFRPLFALSRLGAEQPHWPPPQGDVVLRPLTAEDLTPVAAYDADATGSDRPFLLAHLRARRPEAAWLAERGGRIAGFALSRDGVRGFGIGPVVADDDPTAAALAAAAGRATRGPTMIDVPDGKAAFAAGLAAAGFARLRGFTRMVKGDDRALDRTDRLYALAGPEFG